jgi:hypothetical protein
VPCPEIYEPANVTHFPMFCKPDRGQGSHRARLITNHAEAALLRPGELLLEYLPGVEYTVDCFSDRIRGLLFARGRRRIRVRNGISVATAAVDRAEFREYAELIGSKLTFHGAWFYQLKEAADGTLKLLEVAPRIAGAMAFHRVQGINFALLSLYEQAGFAVDLLLNDGFELRMDRALVNRFRHTLQFRTVYVDLDDTLIVRGAVHLGLITFLYQCVNSGVRIILLTKHAGDVSEHLTRHRLTQLFDEIRHLTSDQQKADAIDCTEAIFIDDSFAERIAVRQRTGIPTFDLSMIEMLADHRGPVFSNWTES